MLRKGASTLRYVIGRRAPRGAIAALPLGASSTKSSANLIAVSALLSAVAFTSAAATTNDAINKWDLVDKSQCSVDDFLYPSIEPYKTGRLQVSKTHSLYYEECGNPNGKPVILVHGGPGGGCTPIMNRFHDPAVYRIIALDQRGSGRSLPHASLEDNTTWHLIADMESLREHLKIDKWQVFGGSWGSTLSTAYAEMHPSRVTELVLRGIFHIRDKEIQFYYQHGANFLYPDRWEAYRDAIPEDERHDFLTAYHKRLTSPDENVRLAAALAWTTWELSTSNLKPPADAVDKSMNDARFAEAFARIENHYFVNKGFFPTPNFLIDQVHKIRHIPTVIVQGRYDVVCPMVTAWEFHKAFPEADLRVVQTAGHSAGEPGIAAELVRATDKFKHNKP
ncbi:prolyl aminopeptidase [Aphanomyces invadans]|uniref:Proline iminopeptidase n=1 Tax=Aphanomyces invadans TaxID=157072 RepID=A0A024TDN0_9STRA|nr:prolyl aminopeptidase [Aphanomyces invadans]ETV92265.1 prolyl aminopeptidase [Aphanomyces invadans]|eukprot:XP_008879229.1 prolyl aminopeptidase [Aphanomyces invadans]